ncbi:complement regulator-acquiring protein (plasmid) [Borreliella finlandensis]|uniref:complement regulator-acquiring protein n=1 Tax=Borreliella finlandensis TaxID=498741 RepID=UPI0026495D00|nr:complement regulator-acquiring protein [Borreliella finlandensis]WKC89543.1 complement regulator-acquiring protein [Borreliella finlandensis]
MITTNLNTTKLSIIVATLTLICVSCAVSPMAPEVNSYTNAKEDTENLKNASGDINSLSQKSLKEVTIAKLKELGNKLTAQKKEEDANMPKDTKNLADELGIYPMYYGKDQEAKEKLEKDEKTKFTVVGEQTQKTEKLKIERIIQASLNYEEGKIKKLKEILEKVKGKDEGEYMIIDLLYGKALDIQTQIDKHLESIKEDNLKTLSEENLKELLIHVEFDLMLKEKFKKTLKKTVEEVPQEIQEIEEESIISYIAENYPTIFDYSTYNAKSKQEKLNELKKII